MSVISRHRFTFSVVVLFVVLFAGSEARRIAAGYEVAFLSAAPRISEGAAPSEPFWVGADDFSFAPTQISLRFSTSATVERLVRTDFEFCVAVLLGTYARVNSGNVEVLLVDASDMRVIGSTSRPASEFVDNDFAFFCFPMPDGRQLNEVVANSILIMRGDAASREDAPSVWMAASGQPLHHIAVRSPGATPRVWLHGVWLLAMLTLGTAFMWFATRPTSTAHRNDTEVRHEPR